MRSSSSCHISGCRADLRKAYSPYAYETTAQRINDRYETYIAQINAGNDQGVKNALEFERTIIATCGSELGFFDHQQMRDLQRLREDRHQCAHPSFQSPGIPHRPTAELARLHLRNAVEHVLSQPPIQGRAAIAELLTTIASDYFPKDHHQASIALLQTPLANPSEGLIRGLVDSLVFGYPNAESPIFGKVQIAAVLSVLLNSHRAVAEPRIAQQLSKMIRQANDGILPSIARLISTFPELVGIIDEAARVRLAEFVRHAPIADVLPVLAMGRSANLQDCVRARVLTLNVDQLSVAILDYGLGDFTKPRALQLLSESRSWNMTNDIIEKLINPLFDSLSPEDIRHIIRMPTEHNTDLVGSNMYASFLDQVNRLNLIDWDEFHQLLMDNNATLSARRFLQAREVERQQGTV